MKHISQKKRTSYKYSEEESLSNPSEYEDILERAPKYRPATSSSSAGRGAAKYSD